MLRMKHIVLSRNQSRHRAHLQRIERRPEPAVDKRGRGQSITLDLPALSALLEGQDAWDPRQLRLYARLPLPAADDTEVRVALNDRPLATIHASARPAAESLAPYTEHMVELPVTLLQDSGTNTVRLDLPARELPSTVLKDISFWLSTPDSEELHDDPMPAASQPNREREAGRTLVFYNQSALEMELVWVDPRGIERNPVTLELRSPGKHSGLRIRPDSLAGPMPSQRTTYPGALFRIYLVDTDDVDNLVGFHVVDREDVQRHFIRIPTLPYDSTRETPEIVTVTADIEKLEEPVQVGGLSYPVKTVLRYKDRLFSKRGLRDTLNGLHLAPSQILERPVKKTIEFRIHDFDSQYGRYVVYEHPHERPTADPDDPSRWLRFQDRSGSGIKRVVEVPFWHEREFNYCVIAKPVSTRSPLALASDPIDIIEGSGGSHGGVDELR